MKDIRTIYKKRVYCPIKKNTSGYHNTLLKQYSRLIKDSLKENHPV